MDNEKLTDGVARGENTAIYAMRIIGEIDAFIRNKHGMGVVVTPDDSTILGVDVNGNIKATFTIALL